MLKNYKCFKLNTGEDIIGVVNNSEQITDPYVIMTKWGTNNELQIGLIPFCPLANNGIINLNSTGYVLSYSPVDDILKQYTRATSGIILP